MWGDLEHFKMTQGLLFTIFGPSVQKWQEISNTWLWNDQAPSKRKESTRKTVKNGLPPSKGYRMERNRPEILPPVPRSVQSWWLDQKQKNKRVVFMYTSTQEVGLFKKQLTIWKGTFLQCYHFKIKV